MQVAKDSGIRSQGLPTMAFGTLYHHSLVRRHSGYVREALQYGLLGTFILQLEAYKETAGDFCSFYIGLLNPRQRGLSTYQLSLRFCTVGALIIEPTTTPSHTRPYFPRKEGQTRLDLTSSGSFSGCRALLVGASIGLTGKWPQTPDPKR